MISIEIEVHTVNSLGENSGTTVPTDELERYKIPLAQLYSIEGYDRDNCLTKVRRVIDAIKAK